MASITIDTVLQSGTIHGSLLNRKNKYIPSRLTPLRMDLKFLSSVKNLENVVSTKNQTDWKNVFSSDAVFRKSFMDTGEPMILFELNGEYKLPNKRLLELLGFTEDEFQKMKLIDFFPDNKKFAALRFYTSLKSKRRHTFNTLLKKRSGKLMPVEISVSSLTEGLYFGIIRDVTKQIEIEDLLKKEEEKYRHILEASSNAIVLYDDTTPIYANLRFLKMVGCESSDLESYNLKKIFSQKDQREIKRINKNIFLNELTYGLRPRRGLVESCQQNNQPYSAEFRLIKHDQTTADCEITFSTVRYGKKKILQLNILDITSQKRFIAELQRSEEKFKLLVESSPLSISLTKDDKFSYCNSAFLKLFGYDSYEKILGQEKFVIGFKNNLERERKPKQTQVQSFRFTGTIRPYGRTDGSTIPVEAVVLRITLHNEEAEIVFYRDISEQIQIEEDLKLRKKDYQLLDRIISQVTQSLDTKEISDTSLKTILYNLGWDCGAVFIRVNNNLSLQTSQGFSEHVAEKLKMLSVNEGIGGMLTKMQEPLNYSLQNYPSYLPHKSTFGDAKISSVCFIPLLAKSELEGIILLGSEKNKIIDSYSVGLLKSIGSHIGSSIANAKSFSHIKYLYEKIENLVGAVSDVLYHGNFEELFQFISPNIETLVGYKQKDFYRNKSLWLSIIHPDDKKYILQRNFNLTAVGNKISLEYRILPKGKAEYLWLRDSITLIKDESKNIVAINGIISDINERKNLENTLRNAEQFKSGILAGISEGIIVLDENFNLIEWNEAMEKITGLSRRDVLGKNMQEMLTNLLSYDIDKYLKLALEGQTISSEDVHYKVSVTKKEGYLWGKFAPLKSYTGTISGVVAIISDITNRKRLEEEIKNSEQILRNVIETMGDVFVLTDLKGTVLEVNREFTRLLAYSRSEAIGKEFPYPWLVEDEMNRFVIWVSNLRAKTFLHDFDMTWRSKDGKKIPISLNTTLLRSSLGDPVAMLNLGRDITERRRLMKELENRNKQIEAINNIIQTANQTMKFEEIFKVFADKIYEVLHFDLLEVCLLKEDKENVEVLAAFDKSTDTYFSGSQKSIGNNIIKIAINERKPVLINDVNLDEKIIVYNIIVDEYISQLSFPFLSKGTIVGAINFYSKETNYYTEENISSIQPYVHQIGSIIDRVLLFKKVSEDASYIHNLLDSIDSVVFTVDNEFKIQEVNKAWFEFIKRTGAKVKRIYSGQYLFDVLTSKILPKDYKELAEDILRGERKIVVREYEYVSDNNRFNYHLTINPMVINDKITGLVFTQTDITDLKRTEAELKSRNEQLLDLSEISTHISASFNMKEILKTALPRILTILKADNILLFLTDKQQENLILTSHAGLPRELRDLELNIKIPVTGDEINYDINTPLFILAEEFREKLFGDRLYELFRDIQASSMAAIPLKSADKTVGVIQLLFTNPHQFTLQEHQLLSLIGNQLGSAIENAQLYTELHSQINRLTILYELSQQLTATLDVDQVLHAVFEQLQRIIDFEEFFINFVDEGRMTLTTALHIKTVNGEKIYLPKLTQPVQIENNSNIWQVVTNKQTLIERIDGVESVTYIPMASKNSVIGLIVLRSRASNFYHETEIKLLESICSLTAIAIEKTKLYEEIVQKSQEIQRRNKELDDFTYVVSHDLKEPLISIEGYSKILMEEFESSLQTENVEFIHSIVQASSRMKNLIDDLLTLSRIGRLSESFKPISIVSVIEDVKLDLQFTIREKNVKLIVPDVLPKVFGNETQLKLLFRNLLSNAIKFSDKDIPVVEIGYEEQVEDMYKFFIKDNGIGIDRQYFEKIFVIFQRLHGREEYQGTGAGLAIVKKIVEMHGGKIWIDSELGSGSTFYFLLQKAIANERQ
ncbi:MAG: PAS domain S-box protein [Bacteroidetes bacterium]|nr:PAS domain S-box protein [Bacteroidota bacterium]